MEKYRVYIADMDQAFTASVRRALASNAALAVVGNAANGRQAMKDIVRLAPDIVLADIPLPELDGIALLRETRRLRHPPAVIICTRFCSDASMQCACKYNAAFFLCKPIDCRALPGLLIECGKAASASANLHDGTIAADESTDGRGEIARSLLREYGMPARLDGCAYLIEAALCAQGDAMLFRNLSNGLYAVLARLMGTTVPRIERSLRSAIGVAYERGSLSRFFAQKPSNKAFLEHFMRAVDAAERDGATLSR